MHKNRELVLVFLKIVNDLRAAGSGDNASIFVKAFNEKFEFGNSWSRTGEMYFFRINTVQAGASTIFIDANDEIKDLKEYKISHVWGKELDSSMHAIGKASFASIKSPSSWIGTAASPLFCFNAS